jgi:hypothetical protein
MKDKRNLLEVLKAELTFLENGGYRRPLGAAWRPPFLFEDSPLCVNHGRGRDRSPCAECVLMQLVPPEYRHGKAPCRHILLNAFGETLDSLYRYGSQHEIEETYSGWLRATIARLEEPVKAIERQEKGSIVRFFA